MYFLPLGTFYSCPEIPQDMVGICSDECTDDSDCENETKCCSNGCGHVCKVPVRIPYYDPPLECPDLSGNQNAGICEEDCSDNTECTNEGELCCSNGCGTACMEAVLVSPRCSAVRDQVLNGTALIGPYIPQCEDDGNFSPTQCWGSTGSCWCVDTQSGEPVSDMIRFKEPQCASEFSGSLFPHAVCIMSVLQPVLISSLHAFLTYKVSSRGGGASPPSCQAPPPPVS